MRAILVILLDLGTLQGFFGNAVELNTLFQISECDCHVDLNRGSVLDVYRVVSVLDPYESKKRFNHRIKIGEVKVLHAEESSAIGVLNKLEEGEDTPVFEIGKMMIGDIVTVKVR